jgi:hypothetical protein
MSVRPPLFVIDSLDAFENLNNSNVTRDIALFIQALTVTPFHIKILITNLYSQMTELLLKSPHFPAHQVHLLHPSESELQEDQARDRASAEWAARNGPSVYTPKRTYASSHTPPRRYDGHPGQLVRLGT